jgi:DNA-binding NtrC family response regulator
MKFFVYGLADPRTSNLIRYIGKTHTPRVRHIQHCAETATSEKGVWIETLRLEGILPQMIILAECPDEESALAKERELIGIHCAAIADDSNLGSNAAAALVNATHKLYSQKITEALALSKGMVAPAARLLGISRPTLYGKMKQLGIQSRLANQPKIKKRAQERLARRAEQAKEIKS